MASTFEPGDSNQHRYTGYAAATFPDSRDEQVDQYVKGVMAGGPRAVGEALAAVSDTGRRVLCAYAERSASLAVRERSIDRLVSALVATVIGGLDRDDREAMMPMALVDDACTRIGQDPTGFFSMAAHVVGRPGRANLMRWLSRSPEDRTPAAMGFEPSHDESGFRYRWRG
jgi:hypothetical protein